MMEDIIEVGICACGCGNPTSKATRNNKKFGWVKGKPMKYIHGHYISMLARQKEPLPIYSDQLCACGCGQFTKLVRKTQTRCGVRKGDANKYVYGHQFPAPAKVVEPNTTIYCMCGCGKLTPIAKRTSRSSGKIAGKPIRYINGHQMANKKQSMETRDKRSRSMSGREPIMSPYIPGVFVSYNKHTKRWACGDPKTIRTSRTDKVRFIAHARAVWEHFNGPVPEGMAVHHKNGNATLLEYDAPENLMLLSLDHNTRLFPWLAKGFGVSESVVTNVYINVSPNVTEDGLLRAMCVELVKITEKRT